MLKLSQRSAIAITSKNTFTITNGDENDNVNVSQINEPSVAEAFSDFVSSIPDSAYIYTKEETLNIINETKEKHFGY